MPEGMLGNLSLAETQGPMRDLENKLAGKNGRMWLSAFNKFLRGEQPWGIPPTFKIITNGRCAEKCIDDLEKNGDKVGDYAKQVLRNDAFIVTSGVTYHLKLIMPQEFDNNDRTNGTIRKVAYSRGLLDLTVELCPYIREMFSDEDLKKMGLTALILMHKPIADSDGNLRELGLNRLDGGHMLRAYSADSYDWWGTEAGFIFLDPVG